MPNLDDQNDTQTDPPVQQIPDGDGTPVAEDSGTAHETADDTSTADPATTGQDSDAGQDADTGKDTDTSQDTDPGKDTDTSQDTDTGKDTDTSQDTDPGKDTDTSQDTDPGKDTDTSQDTDTGKDTDTSQDTDPVKDTDTSQDTDPGKDTDTSQDTDPGNDTDPGKDTDVSQNTDSGTDRDSGNDTDPSKDTDQSQTTVPVQSGQPSTPAQPYRSSSWTALIEELRGDIPAAFVLAWMEIESGGNPCATGGPKTGTQPTGPDGNPREMGLGQLYNPDDFHALGIQTTPWRAYCQGLTQTVTRDLTAAECTSQVKGLIALINRCRAIARKYIPGWSETSSDPWCMDKLVHALPALVTEGVPAVTAKLGRPPANWAEFRKTVLTVTLDANTMKNYSGNFPRDLDNAEKTGRSVT